MRLVILTAFAATLLASPSFAQDSSPGQASAESVQAVGTGVRLTAAVVAVPLRLAGNATGAVLKQTFTGLGEGSRADPFAATPLAVDNEVLSQKARRPAMAPQPMPAVPRTVAP
jgi:hypothetical protein